MCSRRLGTWKNFNCKFKAKVQCPTCLDPSEYWTIKLSPSVHGVNSKGRIENQWHLEKKRNPTCRFKTKHWFTCSQEFLNWWRTMCVWFLLSPTWNIHSTYIHTNILNVKQDVNYLGTLLQFFHFEQMAHLGKTNKIENHKKKPHCMSFTHLLATTLNLPILA